MILRNGWQIVRAYAGAEWEVETARAGLALADVSASSKLSLRGRGVPAFVRALAPDSPALTPLGVTWLRGPEPALACRLTEDHLLLLSLGETLPRFDLPGEPIVATDLTSTYAGFFLVGPNTEDLLRRLTTLDVRPAALPPNSCAEMQLAGMEALLVRTSETALPAMRIYVAWDMAEYVWDRMVESGRDLGITPLGVDGLRSLLES
jgi:glycine cleavage system aminomethyltransferase T